MSENNELEQQSVVDSEAEPQDIPGEEAPGAREDDSQDELDKILAEYERDRASHRESEPKPEQPSLGASEDALSRVTAIEQRIYQDDLDKTVKAVRGSLPDDVFTDSLVEGWIEAEARRKPELVDAWNNRSEDPKRFARVVKGLSGRFEKHFKKMPDAALSEDREAVSHAVRGTSTKAPDEAPPKFGNMSDQEYAAAVEKEYGFRPI